MNPLPPLLLKGDCLEELKRIPADSVDSVICDPPYGLEFMGKAWDKYTPLDFELWCAKWAAECLRILKPGGHLLAFGGSRTWHRLAAGIEDAGFEIRDSIAWLYGSGFPKSLDVSKAIDKLDAAAVRLERARLFQSFVRPHITPKRVNEITGTDMGHHFTTHPTQPAIATADLFDMLRPHLPAVPAEIEALVSERTVESANYAARGSTGKHSKVAGVSEWRERYEGGKVAPASEKKDIPATDAAREWEGWGTALKPAFEPVVVARKPLGEKTVAANVLAHGTGALNIDATRIHSTGSEGKAYTVKRLKPGATLNKTGGNWRPDEDDAPTFEGQTKDGRWPANVALDESQAAALDAQSGTLTSGANPKRRGADKGRTVLGEFAGQGDANPQRGVDTGGASRFFYVAPIDELEERFIYGAKAPKSERPVVDGVAHPTVKSLKVMRWLCRLVTPPGGVVVDPFAGSGTTLEAAYLEGFESIGVEMTPEYWPLIAARIERVTR